MTTDDTTDNRPGRTIRPKILKCLTERPGQVVYRDQIMEEANVTDRQVVSVMHRLLAEGGEIANDIDVVVNGNAWRYVPGTKTVRAMRAQETNKPIGTRDKKKPLTQSIRDYFYANPGRVIYLPELQEAMSTNDTPLAAKLIQVGIANSRHYADSEYILGLRTVQAGRAWQFMPHIVSDGDGDGDTTSSSKPIVTASKTTPKEVPAVPAAPPVVPDSAPIPVASDELMMIERLSVLDDGSLLVRDTSDRQIYVLSKPKLK